MNINLDSEKTPNSARTNEDNEKKSYSEVTQIPQLNTKLDNLNCELENIIEYRTKGAIMRSRIQWHNEGEKNTKYFLSLEKRHYKQGTIGRLKKN